MYIIDLEGNSINLNHNEVAYLSKVSAVNNPDQYFAVLTNGDMQELTEEQYTEMLALDYSGGGQGGGMTPEEKQQLSDLQKYVVTGYDDGGVEPFSDDNAYIADQRGAEIKFDNKRATFDISTYTGGTDDLSFLQGKNVYYVLAYEYLRTESVFDLVLDGFANKGEQYILINSTVGGVMSLLVKDKSDFPVELVYLDFPSTGGWWLVKVTQDDFAITLQTQEIHGWFTGVAGGGHKDGLLDRVSALEKGGGGGSNMVYNTATGILSGAKDENGNDVEFAVGTITITF